MSVLSFAGRALLLHGTALGINLPPGGAQPGLPQPLTLAIRGNVLPTTTSFVDGFWCIYSGGIGPYTFAFANGTTTQSVGTSGANFLLNSSNGSSIFNGGSSPAGAGESDTITVRMTDATGMSVTATYTQTYTTTDCVLFKPDYIFTNQPVGSQNFVGLQAFMPDFTSAATLSYSEPSGLLTVQWAGVNGGYIYVASGSYPPAGAYPATLNAVQGGRTFTVTRNIYIANENGTAFINFTPAPVLSTSLPAGFVVGQAAAGGDADNIYVWSLGLGSSTYFSISNLGQVTLKAAPPTPGSYPLTIICTDGTASYSQTFNVIFSAGTTIASANMTAAIPSGLDNSMSSGTLTTPSVTGFTPTQWLLFGQYGVGTRYQVNASTGQVTIIGALSYQVAADGTAFTDALTLVATDGINTCSKTFNVPVAAVSGPTISIGPSDILTAAGVTGTTYPTLTAAFNALGAMEPGPSNTVVAGTVFQIYSPPAADSRYFTYFLNDGVNSDHGYGTGGVVTISKPITIQGAPGRVFPYFSATAGSLAKGMFAGQNFDLTLRNLTVAKATGGNGNGNICGIYKDAGLSTGNLTIDNCYVHDCDDGIARGSAGSKVFLTNSRISHCGIGSQGLTHNIYIECDLFYASNILTDQSFNGHLLKTRSKNTIIKGSRCIDGQLGCASNVIDIPQGGISSITNTLLHKGPNGQNPYMVKFADPNDQNLENGIRGSGQSNVLTIMGCTFLLDPGKPGLGNVMPAMNTSNASQAEVYGINNASYPGLADGVPAAVTVTSNSFFGLLTANETLIQNTYGAVTIPSGTINVSGSTTIAAGSRPALDFSFPGTGPDPTTNDPPGPFLYTWLGGVGGGQCTAPINIMHLALGAAAGTVVGTVVWSQGNTSIASPVFAINYQSGPNAFAINASTGQITSTAIAVAQTTQADVIGVTVTAGGQQYIWNFVIAVS